MRTAARVLAPVVLLAVASVSGQEKVPGTPTGELEKTIVAQEQALYQAVARQDKTAFQSLTIAEGTWTTTSGFVPIRLLGDDLGAFSITQFAVVNPLVKPLGAEAALVTYVRTGEGTFGGQALPRNALASTVWVRRDGSWRAIHHQETELAR